MGPFRLVYLDIIWVVFVWSVASVRRETVSVAHCHFVFVHIHMCSKVSHPTWELVGSSFFLHAVRLYLDMLPWRISFGWVDRVSSKGHNSFKSGEWAVIEIKRVLSKLKFSSTQCAKDLKLVSERLKTKTWPAERTVFVSTLCVKSGKFAATPRHQVLSWIFGQG